jgi:protein dithiol oxidoreductase (disulfide-forming)
MRLHLTLSLATVLGIAACSSQTPSVPPAGAEPAAAVAAAAPAAPAASSAVSAATAPAPATTELGGESSGVEAVVNSTQSNLERATPMPSVGNLPSGRWVAGTNYRVISPAQPTNAAPGKVEVVEMFWYGCPHCLAFDPFLDSWKKSLPSYIEFTRVPAMFSANYRSHARLFYTMESLGKSDALHAKIFDEVQNKNHPLIGNDDAASLKLQQAFAQANGINESDYAKAFDSFTVRTKLSQAEDLTLRYRVEGVPAIIINGKYYSDVGMAGSHANLISLINDLAAAEKRR